MNKLLLIISLLTLGACGFTAAVKSTPSTTATPSGPVSVSEAAQIEMTKLQQAQQQKFFDLQLQVVNACVKSGNVPVMSGGGNVDCKPMPKRP